MKMTLSDFVLRSEKIIIMGDLNIHVNAENNINSTFNLFVGQLAY